MLAEYRLPVFTFASNRAMKVVERGQFFLEIQAMFVRIADVACISLEVFRYFS